MRLAVGAGAILAAAAVAACGVIPAPPGPLKTTFIPEATPVAATATPSSDGFTTEQHLAVRIRVATCQGWATGSGWILNSHEVITNRHVAEGATHIEVTTYDGHDYVVNSSLIAKTPDLALLNLDDVFTESATMAEIVPTNGAPMTVVGYPLGQALTVAQGHFIGTEVDSLGDSGQNVWLINAHIDHGSSGSPVYDAAGKVVAIVYAGDPEWDALAWPASSLQGLLDDPTGWTNNSAAC
ncbi:S1 family peptidase [Demequina lutea]|uniref:Serine protease n=1 Tax=Demequina lutea TaxID=431489 RepID=A0A7Y9ZAR0_9MICO|nr:serine protease [Demequina lutea]NYI41736.1 S1-C subfamily serine protease [Demequina lutea]